MRRNRLLVALLSACAFGSARAEVSLGLVSDYRFRGISLTDNEPAVQAGLVWDSEDGWYAGVFAASTRIARVPGVQLVQYLGRTRRLQSGRSWEAGVQYVVFSKHRNEDYREVYLGVASDRWSARAYYQPKPLGDYGPAAYLEGSASVPLSERMLLLGHVGAGWRGGELEHGVDRVYYDGRVGLGMVAGAYNVYLQRVMTVGRSGYLADDIMPNAADAGWVVGVTRVW